MSIKLKKDNRFEDEVSIKDLQKVGDKLEEAEDSNEPFIVHNEEDSLTVIGDANETENKLMDVTIEYRFMEDELEEIPKDAETAQFGNTKYVVIPLEYKEVNLPARKDHKLMASAIRMQPYFVRANELRDEHIERVKQIEEKYGSVFKYDGQGNAISQSKNDKVKKTMEKAYVESHKQFSIDLVKLYGDQKDEVIDAIYTINQVLLDVDETINDHMTPYSAVLAILNIIDTFPNIFNEASVLFGLH